MKPIKHDSRRTEPALDRPGRQDSTRAGRQNPDRNSWRRALGKVWSPALRLHRYRNAHNRLLQDALQMRDCAPERVMGC